MKTQWDFKLFYTSSKSPQIKKDVAQTKRNILQFEKKYRNSTDYLKSDIALARALKDYEVLIADPSAERVLSYYFFSKELDASNNEANAQLTKLGDEFTKLENKVLFFTLQLGKISPVLQKRFLKSSKLKRYHYFLKNLFENSKYDLSEAEEKILNLKSHTSYGMWIDGVDKLLSKQMVRYKGKEVPISEALGKVHTLPTKDRHALSDAVMERFKSISDFAESEINAVVSHKKTNDELRGFKHPYSATILGYENNEKSVLSLVDTVTKSYKISHRFFKLKAEILGLKSLHYADRSASIGKTAKKISFSEASKIYNSVLEGVDDTYADMFKSFLEKGQVDVYPRKGKTGGAYCASGVGLPTMVLLNHTDDFRSFTTLAHEMGHAFHAEMSKEQPPLYEGHSTSVAETASTLFEQLAFESIFESLSPKEQIVALHDKINDDISSIFRQVAFFNFERDLHTAIRSKGFIPKEDIAKLLNHHMKAYLGPLFSINDLDGYFFVAVSHFRRFFYVYSYAYGQLISRAMVEQYKKDPSYSNEIRRFLSAGGSMSPEDIFESIGIDTTKPSFFLKGLKGIDQDITRLEKLIKQNGGLK